MEEEIQYTIAADGAGHPGSKVDLIVTYDASAPVSGAFDAMTYQITSATGTYHTIDADGNVLHTDTITGLIAPGDYAGNDNLIDFRDGTTQSFDGARTILDGAGVSFTLSDPTDGNDGAGHVNLFGTDAYHYGEAGDNPNATNDLTYGPVCFASGTRIRTARGDVAVEALAVGDEILTVSGRYRPVRWIGHRRVDCRRAPDPAEMMPIRIAAGAFGESRPARDLLVSPGHAICVTCVDEVLIPAWALVNGGSVVQIDVAEVTYWHVELDAHDVLLAEGLPAESYIDTGNRKFFECGEGRVDAERRRQGLADYCRPFFKSGPLVHAVRERLSALSLASGWTLSTCPRAGLHLMADGRRVEPLGDGLSVHFPLAAGVRDMRLVSQVAIPSEQGTGVDERRLGVQIRSLAIGEVGIPLDHPALGDGLNELETDSHGRFRWSRGAVDLPAELWLGRSGELLLRVELGGAIVPRWVAPAASIAAAPMPVAA